MAATHEASVVITHSAAKDDFTIEEMNLAHRCYGMSMESLIYDSTPVGQHYVLTHYDIPVLGEEFVLEVTGAVNRTLRLTLKDLKSRPKVSLPVMMECAGNGRILQTPRIRTSMPWSYEAIGCATWTGTPLAGVLEEALLDADVVDLIFTGADRGRNKQADLIRCAVPCCVVYKLQGSAV